jgi:hypothetical protein
VTSSLPDLERGLAEMAQSRRDIGPLLGGVLRGQDMNDADNVGPDFRITFEAVGQ